MDGSGQFVTLEWHRSCTGPRMLGKHVSGALAHLKEEWRRFRRMPPGRRFQIHYKEQKLARQSSPGFLHALPLLLVPLLVAVGVVLMFIPGPAILFFFLAAVLLTSHSPWLARILDGAE